MKQEIKEERIREVYIERGIQAATPTLPAHGFSGPKNP